VGAARGPRKRTIAKRHRYGLVSRPRAGLGPPRGNVGSIQRNAGTPPANLKETPHVSCRQVLPRPSSRAPARLDRHARHLTAPGSRRAVARLTAPPATRIRALRHGTATTGVRQGQGSKSSDRAAHPTRGAPQGTCACLPTTLATDAAESEIARFAVSRPCQFYVCRTLADLWHRVRFQQHSGPVCNPSFLSSRCEHLCGFVKCHRLWEPSQLQRVPTLNRASPPVG